MILVTGSTGHVGNVLIRKLVSMGESVKAFICPCEDITSIKELSVEKIYGDVTDIESLKVAMKNVDIVYHLAGIISTRPGMKEILQRVNVKGTKNVIEACKVMGVKRLVYVSSIHALEDAKNGIIISEKLKINPLKAIGDYGFSKAKATLEVIEAAKNGFNATIVCPTGIIGPYDFKPSQMGSLILSIMKGKFPVKITGAYDFVDVRDVVEGIVLAAKKGRAGQHYILSGQRISIDELIEKVCILTGQKIPKFQIPSRLLYIYAFFNVIGSFFTRKNPLVTFESIHILNSNSNISNELAKNELGYSPRSLDKTLKDTVKWFHDNLNFFNNLSLIHF